MLKLEKQLIKRVMFFSIVSIFAGCTVKVPVTPLETNELKPYQKLPVKAALLITPETKNYIFKGRPESFVGSARPHNFPLGNMLEKASLQIFSQIFEKIVLVRTTQEAGQYEVYLEPKIEDFHFQYKPSGFFLHQHIFYLCKIKINITLASGKNIILEKIVESPQIRKPSPALVSSSAYEKIGKATTQAIVTALKKFRSEIMSPLIRQAIYEIRNRKHLAASKEKQMPFSTSFKPENIKKGTNSVVITSQKVYPSPKINPKTFVSSYPNRYLFISVVYDYDELSDLNYVKNDIDLVKTLGKFYLGVPENNIKILKNPSLGKLKKDLKKFAQDIGLKDAILYFYYSGHGILDSRGKFYLLPSDASIDDEQILKDTAISIDILTKLLAKAKGYKVAFIDACRINPPWKPAVLRYKPPTAKISFIFSTKQGQVSNIDRSHTHSAFTRAFYEMAQAGVLNLDLDESGYIEIKEIEKPLKNWLKKVSCSPDQTPDIWGPKDIPLFPVK